MGKHCIKVLPDGTVVSVYSDDTITPLGNVGSVEVSRASNVEWSDNAGGWMVKFIDPMFSHLPVQGPFYMRADALSAEVATLQKELGGVYTCGLI